MQNKYEYNKSKNKADNNMFLIQHLMANKHFNVISA